jgi:hypothetical protein
MNYQQPGNFLQDQGYFQINTSLKELQNNPTFKLFLSGQYLLELTDVCIDTQWISIDPLNTSTCFVINVRSPQFSSTMSETPGITFRPPDLTVHENGASTISKTTGQVKVPPNKILATLNGSIQLNLFVWYHPDTSSSTAVYEPADEYFIFEEDGDIFLQNVIFSFGFQYSKVK